MRVNREAFAAHGAAILENAGKLFRGRGIDAVSVADVARASGLTHGAFYGHFASKHALAAQSAQASLETAAAKWRNRAERARAEGEDPLGVLIDRYLTEAHRDAPESGCTLSALGPELARAEGELRTALARGTEALAAVLDEELARDRPSLAADARAARVLAILSAMVGGLALARALKDDPNRSRTALHGAAKLARMAARSD